jgi:Alr-MurF fusion protein
MITFLISEIAEITGGKLLLPDGFQDTHITHVLTDSRTFFNEEHTLFFALRGPRNDGHQYIPFLLSKGVKAFVVSDDKSITAAAAFILVKDTTAALQKLAAFIRRSFKGTVLGITGSNGKTIVKEWMFELLSEEFNIVRSPKSYNSQVGVPLSVMLIDNHYNLAIIEAGISEPGEMTNLAPVVRPEIGILTNIGDAHQENFRSKKEKTLEKLQLFDGAEKLIFCCDDTATASVIAEYCLNYHIEQINWTLQDNAARIRLKKNTLEGSTVLTAHYNEQSWSFTIPFTDDSSVENACHCFSAGLVLLHDPQRILHRFSSLVPVAMRLEIRQGINNCLLINDYYNSDLASLTIALSVLHQQAKKGQYKKQVILSDIMQTGLPPQELYMEVNKLLVQWGIDELIGIGPEITAHAGIFSTVKSFYTSTEDFEKQARRNDFANSTILIKGARSFTFERISALLQQKAHQTVLEIDLNALVHNLNVFRSLLRPETKIMVMVKAFSYGSGDVEIAKALQFHQADYLAVAVADEGIELRQAGIRLPIVVMNPEEQSFKNIIDYRLEPNIYSLSLLKKFTGAVSLSGERQFPIHLKLDTGMNRLGFKSDEEVEEALAFLSQNNLLKVVSVFSHLAASDDPSFDEFTMQQIERFRALLRKIETSLPYPFTRHILNSAGMERFPEYQMDMVRLGIGLYGVSVTGLPLQGIGTFRSVVSQVKRAVAGETIGYSRKGTISRTTDIAIVPVGYADGLDRKLGNLNGEAFIRGKKVPIVGNICMDMLMLDVTGLDVQPGDEVEFFGPHITVSEVAKKAGTIPYEVLTGISQRVKRIYLYE